MVKDNLFEPPVVFKLIQEASGSDDREMYQVFNMGHRLEVFTDAAAAGAMIDAGRRFNIEGRIVGRVEAAAEKNLILKVGGRDIRY